MYKEKQTGSGLGTKQSVQSETNRQWLPPWPWPAWQHSFPGAGWQWCACPDAADPGWPPPGPPCCKPPTITSTTCLTCFHNHGDYFQLATHSSTQSSMGDQMLKLNFQCPREDSPLNIFLAHHGKQLSLTPRCRKVHQCILHTSCAPWVNTKSGVAFELKGQVQG